MADVVTVTVASWFPAIAQTVDDKFLQAEVNRLGELIESVEGQRRIWKSILDARQA